MTGHCMRHFVPHYGGKSFFSLGVGENACENRDL